MATGDATNSGIVITEGNTNSLSDPQSDTGGISVANTGNGADSTNSGSITVNENNTTTQTNSADVDNNLDLSTVTGQNSASMNNGNSTIITGDANVSGTAITAVNTNLAGVSVSEFNIVDDHQGDYVLDFAANCISGCSGGGASAENSGNGAASNNTSQVSQTTTDSTTQTNTAAIGNDMVLSADSGSNTTNFNTAGDNAIITGDANVSASSLTLANNNVSGEIVFGVVNIYGDLVGDIVFPEEMVSGCCVGGATASNTGNGADSTNTAVSDTTLTDTTVQTNEAVIDNNLVILADTGDNSTSANTNGDNLVATGDTNVNASVMNVANSNVDGGVWWLVLVNQAGNWVGQILGAPGTNMAGSEGTQFVVNEAGEITVTNSANGAGSENTASASQTTTQTTTQSNTANVSNNLTLSATTGGNSASYNTGGDNVIRTGDANVIANIVNFVNNNIATGGKLVVTVVNVFGSWLGNFVTPGHNQDLADNTQDTNLPDPAVGGDEINPQSETPAADPTPTTTPTAAGTVTTPPPAPSPLRRVITRTGRRIPITPQVAGYLSDSSSNPVLTFGSTTAAKNIVHINLAWMLLLSPVLLVLLVRRFIRRRQVTV